LAARTVIRRALRSDSSGFIELVLELAKFEKLVPPDGAARRRLVSDVFEKKRVHLIVAERDDMLVGYALYFFTYSSFLARPTLYLEDIFVKEGYRGSGVGSALFGRCVDEADRLDCGRMEWAVLRWNSKAIGFYERLGAKSLEEWSTYRLTSDSISALNDKKKARAPTYRRQRTRSTRT